jgi:hypothetical protein
MNLKQKLVFLTKNKGKDGKAKTARGISYTFGTWELEFPVPFHSWPP